MKNPQPESPRSPDTDFFPESSEVVRELSLTLVAGRLSDWTWDAGNGRVAFSQHGARVLGLDAGAPATVSALSALVRAEDREAARLAVAEALRSGADCAFECRIQRTDATECWVSARGIVLRAGDGAVRGMIGLLQDVTDRRRTEELRQRLAAIVESSDDAIVSKSLEGIILSWNRGAERIFGYRPEEIVGSSVLKLIPQDRHQEEREILATLMKGQRIEHYETVRVRKDGTLVHVSLTVSPVLDDGGRIVGASKIARDISARRRSEAKLREESQTLNLLNATGRAIAADLDRASILQKVVDAATVLSGAQFGAFYDFAREEERGEEPHSTSTEATPEAFARALRPNAAGAHHVKVRGAAPMRSADLRADEGLSPAALSALAAAGLSVRSYLAVPVVARSGEVVGELVLGHAEPQVFTQRSEDLVAGIAAQAAIAIDNARLYDGERRAAEERNALLEAERAARADLERVSLIKDEFLATLSHELRTPLNAILGWVQVLETEPGLEQRVRDSVAVIKRNAKTQAALIEDLLDMSRIISGKLRLDVQQVDLTDVIQRALEAVRPSAEAKQIRLQSTLDPLCGPVRGDHARLQQCVWNLLSNAIKFTPKGGQVHVTLARANGLVVVSVSDSGQGIEPEFLPHVFERFRQADASTTRRHAGLGLGLSIVKSLVELHGGNVRATSAGKSAGSTFVIELPPTAVGRDATSSRGTDPHGGPVDEPSLAGLTLVVVDDEADARALLQRVLSACGAVVHLAESAGDGYELVRARRPHLLISDIGMPGQSGYELIRRIRALAPDEGGRTPAMALSAFARGEDRTRSLRAGYQAHVAKPVDVAELIALVASLAAER